MRLVSIFVLAILLGPLVAHGDEPRVPVPLSLLSRTMPAEVHERLLVESEHAHLRGTAMLASGIVLTVIGQLLTVAGPSIMIDAALCDRCTGDRISAAIGMTSIGPIMMLVGIPLWAVGAAKSRSAKRASVVLTGNGFRF